MRKIEKMMNFAISNKADWSSSNTRVEYNNSTNCSSIYLHGHHIATFCHETRAVKINSCGYQIIFKYGMQLLITNSPKSVTQTE